MKKIKIIKEIKAMLTADFLMRKKKSSSTNY